MGSRETRTIFEERRDMIYLRVLIAVCVEDSVAYFECNTENFHLFGPYYVQDPAASLFIGPDSVLMEPC